MFKKGKDAGLMGRIGLWFYDHKNSTFLLWAMFSIFGLVAYTTLLQRQGFPVVDVPISVVSGTYVVDDSARVDTDIVKPISQEIKKISNVKSVTSNAGKNFFTFIIEYKDGVSSDGGNIEVQKVIADKNMLPKGVVAKYSSASGGKFAEQTDLLLSVSSKAKTSGLELQKKAAEISELFSGLRGVKKRIILEQYSSGVDPRTNENVTIKQNFDRIGYKTSDGLELADSVLIGFVADENTDVVTLYDEVAKLTDDLQKQGKTSDVNLNVAAEFATGIRNQISSLQINLLEGLFVVLIVAFALITWRASLTIAFSMVAVVLVTLGVLYLTGNTLNTITLFALILSLGLIVDDTTIMVEAIDANRGTSHIKRDIIASSIKKVARASTVGTITTIMAFAPMLFISGILGKFIRIMPITIIISLVVSLIVSVVLVPFLSRYIILVNRKHVSKHQTFFGKFVSYLSSKIGSSIMRAGHKGKKFWLRSLGFVFISVIALFVAVYFMGRLKFDIFPSTKDSDVISMSVRFAPGTDIVENEKIFDEALNTATLNISPEVRRITLQNTGSRSSGTAIIDLMARKDRKRTSKQLIEIVEKDLSGFKDMYLAKGVVVKIAQIDAGPPKDDLPFKVQIYGEDRAKTQAAAGVISNFLDKKQLTRISGDKVNVKEVVVSQQDLIVRKNAKSYAQVRAGFDADDATAVVTLAQDAVKAEFGAEKLASLGLEKDALAFDFGTESDNQDSFKSMLVAFPILLIAMYVLMLVQFRSFLQPLIIFAAIPYSFLGVGLGLFVTGNPLSFFVMVGFFALIGVVLNNTIMLTDYYNQARLEKNTVNESVIMAVHARIRPLLTTSLISILALLPLALSDPFWESLSITLMCGVLSSTILVLVSFPYLLLIAEKLRRQK